MRVKKSTFNGLRNIRMLQHCWNMLSKRTEDWAEIRDYRRSVNCTEKLESTPKQPEPRHDED